MDIIGAGVSYTSSPADGADWKDAEVWKAGAVLINWEARVKASLNCQ